MWKVGIGGLIHETNTFSSTPTTVENFLKADGFYPALCSGDEILEFGKGRFNIATSGFLSVANELSLNISPLTWCGAEPSAPLCEVDFNYLLDLLVDSIRNRMPLDGLFLDLHGAMVFGNLQDGETEILRRIRQIVGEIPVVVSLDLHGNISRDSFELATAMIGYRTYPHVDGFENGERCAKLLAYLLDGGKIAGAFRQSPFLMPSTTQATSRDPAKSAYAYLESLEHEKGILSISMMEGFPPCDLPHTGPSIFAYADTQESADNAADSLLDYLLVAEENFQIDLLPCEEAVEKAIALARGANGPVLLADIQDNAGGGSPSDSTWLMQELIRQKATQAAIGLIHDPDAAIAAHKAGIGATIELAVGGHALPGHQPVRGAYLVLGLHEGEFLGTGPMVGGRAINLGKIAHLKLGDLHVVVSEMRMQVLDQSQFRVVGIEPRQMSILALKSANHFRADFGPISAGIVNVEAPSSIIEDPSKIPYTRLREGVRLKGKGPEFKRKP